jgi:hypothetical protein
MKDVIPEEFFEKAVGAMEKSRYWEILDCPTVLNLAETQARLAESASLTPSGLQPDVCLRALRKRRQGVS